MSANITPRSDPAQRDVSLEEAAHAARRRFYIDPEIQFPLIISLILLVTAEGFLVGWGFYKAIVIAHQWERSEQVWDFFGILLLTVVPTVLVNFAFGTYFSHKIAGPLYKLRKAMAEVARGNLEVEVSLRRGDFLQSCAVDCNHMIQTLRHLIYRDHQYAGEVNGFLTDCEHWLAEQKGLGPSERARLQKLINEAKNRLSIINAHFTKGKREKA